MLIISETKNGSIHPSSAYIVYNEADFVVRINELAYQQHSDSAGEIQTAADAVAYLDERHAQLTEIIDQASYCDGLGDKVDACAKGLGWLKKKKRHGRINYECI